MSKKPVIVFEGIEGSGKSYHLNNVSKFLKRKKIKHVVIREPGGSKNSEKIRDFILNKNINFHNLTDLLLYLSARNENYNSILKKNFKKKIILIDRFTDSTIAYQHFGMGLNLKIINLLNSYILKDFKASFSFLNTVNTKNLKLRLKKRKKLNRYDKFNSKFYSEVQKGYFKIFSKRKNYMIIDSNLPINANKKIIINKILDLIS
tara:strand:- start:29 stop:643 length:615 start_codon:yes stop_codon:yes gene_type:complete